MTEYKILNEEGTRFTPKFYENGVFQVWFEFMVNGKPYRQRLSMDVKHYNDGTWKKRVGKYVESKTKELETDTESPEDKLKKFKKDFVGKKIDGKTGKIKR